MKPLNENERKELIALIEAGEPLPEKWRGRLFYGSGSVLYMLAGQRTWVNYVN